MSECRSKSELVEERIDRIGTRFRESPNLLAMVRAYLSQTADAILATCSIPSFFDIDTATGDQLTILGKALGWPRCHCRGQVRPVFGFACKTNDCAPSVLIGGFCEAEWDCNGSPVFVEFCFADDEMYRGFLKARVVSLTGDYTRSGLTAAAREVFGPLAMIFREGPGFVSIAAPRVLSNIEMSIVHLYRHVLPVPPGIRLEIWHGPGVPFGFGEGWGGFCDGSYPSRIHDMTAEPPTTEPLNYFLTDVGAENPSLIGIDNQVLAV